MEISAQRGEGVGNDALLDLKLHVCLRGIVQKQRKPSVLLLYHCLDAFR